MGRWAAHSGGVPPVDAGPLATPRPQRFVWENDSDLYGRCRAAHHSCLVAATRIHAAICMGPCGDGRDLYGRTAVVLLYVWKRGSELY